MLTVISPPLKEVRELAQRSMCMGGCFYNPKFIEVYSYNQRVRSPAPNSHKKYINN